MPGKLFHKPLRAIPTIYNGVRYASRMQANRAAELDMLVRAGKVAWWLREVAIDIGEPGVDKPYRVDFLVASPYGTTNVLIHAEDTKVIDTPSFRRHVRMWKKRGPFPLHVIRARGQVEIIEREG